MSSRFFNDRSAKQDTPTAVADGHSAGRKIDVEDAYLVLELQMGKHDALTILFEKYSGMVFDIARRILRGNSSEAEEVVQQVFLETYRGINRFDPTRGSYKTWLFQFVYHRAMNRKKYLEVKHFYSTEELDDFLLPVKVYEESGQMLRLSPRDAKQFVQQILDTIQPEQRATIELTFFEGLTAQEIADRTGETAAAVRHSLYRGLDKLREGLLKGDARQESPAEAKSEGILLADPARSV